MTILTRSEAETKEVLKKIATINNNTTDIQALELVKVPSHREAGSILQVTLTSIIIIMSTLKSRAISHAQYRSNPDMM